MADEKRPALETNNVPDQDGRDRNLRKDRRPMTGAGDEPRGVVRDIADADKKVRTGSAGEAVRNTETSAPMSAFAAAEGALEPALIV